MLRATGRPSWRAEGRPDAEEGVEGLAERELIEVDMG